MERTGGRTLLALTLLGACCGCGMDERTRADGGTRQDPTPIGPAVGRATTDAARETDAVPDAGTDAEAGTGMDAATDAVDASDPWTDSPPSWVNDVIPTVCDADPPELALPRDHGVPGCGEEIAVTLAMDDGKDVSEVGGTVRWASRQPYWATVASTPGNPDRMAVWGVGAVDLFDLGAAEEPKTSFEACVLNDCPADAGLLCPSIACVTIPVACVVNLEGDWTFVGATFGDAPVTISVAQEGRTIRLVDHGGTGDVRDAAVRWTDGDFLYEGIAADRSSLTGTVTDRLSGTEVGAWTATRE